MLNPGAIAQQQQGVAAGDVYLPAPVGGLNTRDALSVMSPGDAITMDNWFPSVNGVEIRKGHASYATGLASNVETLAEYHSGSTRKFLAASGSIIYDISLPGAATALATGFSNARWQYTNFNGFSLWVNGADTPQKFDGTSFVDNIFTGTGLTPTNLVGITAFKNRLFLWENDSQDFWYGGLNAIQGVLTKFPLSLVGRVGGNLVSIRTISRDGGSGPDDYIAFFMSSGEVFVYQGSDPSDASAWAIVGRYNIGEPIHQRALLDYLGDVQIVTKSDINFLSEIISAGGPGTTPSKLSGAISDAARSYGSNYGWQAIFYPRGNRVLINVPVSTNVQYWQYGFNTITKAPFRFKGMNARCWGIYNNNLYFGGNGAVYKADTGAADNGGVINATIQQAFSSLGSASDKQILQYQPFMSIIGSVTFTAGFAFDFGGVQLTQTNVTTAVGTPWGSPWGSYWSPENHTTRDVFGSGGIGSTVSLQLQSSTNGQEVTWHQTRFKFQPLYN